MIQVLFVKYMICLKRTAVLHNSCIYIFYQSQKGKRTGSTVPSGMSDGRNLQSRIDLAFHMFFVRRTAVILIALTQLTAGIWLKQMRSRSGGMKQWVEYK